MLSPLRQSWVFALATCGLLLAATRPSYCQAKNASSQIHLAILSVNRSDSAGRVTTAQVVAAVDRLRERRIDIVPNDNVETLIAAAYSNPSRANLSTADLAHLAKLLRLDGVVGVSIDATSGLVVISGTRVMLRASGIDTTRLTARGRSTDEAATGFARQLVGQVLR